MIEVKIKDFPANRRGGECRSHPFPVAGDVADSGPNFRPRRRENSPGETTVGNRSGARIAFQFPQRPELGRRGDHRRIDPAANAAADAHHAAAGKKVTFFRSQFAVVELHGTESDLPVREAANPLLPVVPTGIPAEEGRIVLHGGDAGNLPPVPQGADLLQLSAAAHQHGRTVPGEAPEQIFRIDGLTAPDPPGTHLD